MLRRFAWLALVLTAGPAAAANIDATAAWRGWAGAAGSGELLLNLPAVATSGQASVALQAGPQRIESSVDVKAAASTALRLPAPTDAPVEVVARLPDGSIAQGQFKFQLSERPLFAWAAGATPAASDADVNLLAVGPEDFPRLAAAYGSVAAVGVDDATLKALDDAQVNALLAHLRGCGFTVLSAVSTEVSAAFRQAAGCGGRQLIASPQAISADDALRLFKNREAWAPVRGAALASLAPADRRVFWVIIALTGYCALAVIAITLTPKAWWLLAAPVTACVAIGLAFAWLAPRQQIVIWAEARGGDSQARFTGRLHLLGTAPRKHAVTIPALINQADLCDPPARSVVNWDAQARRTVSSEMDPQLFATRALCFSGSFPLSYQAAAMQHGAGELELTNVGNAAWQDAALIWEGRVYRASGLGSQRSLRLAPQSGAAPASAAERIAAERLGWGKAGLLLPLQLTALGTDAGDARGWVLVSLPIAAPEST